MEEYFSKTNVLKELKLEDRIRRVQKSIDFGFLSEATKLKLFSFESRALPSDIIDSLYPFIAIGQLETLSLKQKSV